MLERLPNRVDMQRFLEGRQPSYIHQARQQAQKLIESAWEAQNPVQQNAYAMGAIANFPPSADAFVILAKNAPTPAARLEFYRRGVEAGEMALGPEFFERAKGFFWRELSTRPYMRSRLGLANELWSAGREDEALDHFRELIKLNPNDNQSIRYVLAAYLAERNEFDELSELVDRFNWDSDMGWYRTQMPEAQMTEAPGHSM